VNNYDLFASLLQHLQALLPTVKATLLANLALMVLALAQSADCHLAILATVLPLEGQRENLIQRLRRWLKSRALSQRVYYLPLLKHLLAHWHGAELALILDRTDRNNRWSVLKLGLAFGKRVVPCLWVLLPFGSTNAGGQLKLLKQLQPYLPDPQCVRITLLADAAFRAVAIQQYCRDHGWHWQLGVKSDTTYPDGQGDRRPLSTIAIQQGQRVYRQGIYLTKEHHFGPVNLIVDWQRNEEAPRYLVLDQPADRHTWRRGRKRFWIEPTFRDGKSYGFDLENSELDDPQRLANLLLAMAITYVWMLFLGHSLTQDGQRILLEAEDHHDYSLFRLGRDWLRRCLALGQPVAVGFVVSP
jgi:hypothetical protein